MLVACEDALHGFTNPEATANGEKYGLLKYDETVDKRSWDDMKAFCPGQPQDAQRLPPVT